MSIDEFVSNSINHDFDFSKYLEKNVKAGKFKQLPEQFYKKEMIDGQPVETYTKIADLTKEDQKVVKKLLDKQVKSFEKERVEPEEKPPKGFTESEIKELRYAIGDPETYEDDPEILKNVHVFEGNDPNVLK